MEKQKETIQPVEEEELEQATGGFLLPDEQEVKTQENVNFPPTVQPRFI